MRNRLIPSAVLFTLTLDTTLVHFGALLAFMGVNLASPTGYYIRSP